MRMCKQHNLISSATYYMTLNANSEMKLDDPGISHSCLTGYNVYRRQRNGERNKARRRTKKTKKTKWGKDCSRRDTKVKNTGRFKSKIKRLNHSLIICRKENGDGDIERRKIKNNHGWTIWRKKRMEYQPVMNWEVKMKNGRRSMDIRKGEAKR